ncbi:MAG TPA: hypothetical protein VE082_06285 [Desulfobaccales bacterium]|jgi:hypothetical protein|nr:hypothetical protein [Desulfobaccales bacterium]
MNRLIRGSGAGRLGLALVAGIVLLVLGGCAALTGTSRPAPVTVGQIVKWSHEGVPPQDIINLMQDSGTVYRLSAAQLAELKQKGVSDSVLNYMQQTYLSAVRENQARRDFAYWYWGPDGYWYGGPPYGW